MGALGPIARDLGPVLPSPDVLRRQAAEAQRLSLMVIELTAAGPRRDLPRASRLMEKLRAVVGPVAEGDSE